MNLTRELGRTKLSTFTWSQDDCILYGLAVGVGASPQELKFVYEKELVPLPTFSSVAAREAGLKASDLDVNYSKVVHKSQSTLFHSPLPASGTLAVDSRVTRVEDRGIAKGAEIRIETLLTDSSHGSATATIETTLLARGDGTLLPQPPTASSPFVSKNRSADLTVQIPVALNSALLYRLCGDRNPIHVDPIQAAAVGFPRPLLQGLCFYGIVCHALLRECCAFDQSQLAGFSMNFSAPVFPGDELELSIWLEGYDVAFQVNAPRRNSIVSKGGTATLRASRLGA
jgi:acyl dehydratase